MAEMRYNDAAVTCLASKRARQGSCSEGHELILHLPDQAARTLVVRRALKRGADPPGRPVQRMCLSDIVDRHGPLCVDSRDSHGQSRGAQSTPRRPARANDLVFHRSSPVQRRSSFEQAPELSLSASFGGVPGAAASACAGGSPSVAPSVWPFTQPRRRQAPSQDVWRGTTPPVDALA